jgi:hypothetical protein
MKQILIALGLVVLTGNEPSLSFAQDFSARHQAERAAADAMARAMAEKARNDEIVRQQHIQQERQRQQQEDQIHRLEEMQRRANTG